MLESIKIWRGIYCQRKEREKCCHEDFIKSKILLTEEEAIPVKSLAEKIGVSKRTTQRELEYISSYLKGYEIKYFSKTGVGIWLEGTQEEKKRFLSFLCQNESLDVPGGNR